MNLDPFHAWLRDANLRFGAVTVVQLMDEIGSLRQAVGLATYANLPTDGITCQQWLERLASQGLARWLNAKGDADTQGTYWRWAEAHPAIKESQRSLFG